MSVSVSVHVSVDTTCVVVTRRQFVAKENSDFLVLLMWPKNWSRKKKIVAKKEITDKKLTPLNPAGSFSHLCVC